MRRGSTSILLNSPAQSPSQAPQPLPSSYAASTASNGSSDVLYRTTSAPTPTRRIRFAPLPETATSDATDTPTRTDSPHSVCTPSSLTPTASITSNPSKPTFKSNILRQLNIFKRSPLSSPTNSIDLSSNLNPNPNPNPNQSSFTEDVASRLLRRPRTPDLSSSISRITSVAKRPSSAHGYKPRTSVNTLGSGGGRHSMSLNRSANSSSTSSSRTSVPKKSGIRMLNGRVYGSRPNPFDNIRDEPEFVEWGYGGMGSVTGSSNSKYSVLASGSPALLTDTHSQKVVAGTGRGGVARAAVERDEEDDGSGMNWVRKRREERERLAREKEAQERRSGAGARRSGETSRSSLDNPIPSSIDTDSRRTSMDGSFALDTDLSTLAASSAPTTPPSTTDALPLTGLTSEEEEEHRILQAVILTPKHHHFSHHKRPSAQVHLPKNQDPVVGTTVGSDKNDLSPMSESSSETDGQDETLKDDDDDDSESEQNEGQRKTSLGAGVEKISRHIEVAHKDGGR